MVEPRAYPHDEATRDFGYDPLTFEVGITAIKERNAFSLWNHHLYMGRRSRKRLSGRFILSFIMDIPHNMQE